MGCSEQPQHDISVYHWKTNYEPNAFEQGYVDSLEVKKTYLKFFDLKWVEKEQEAFPFAIIHKSKADSIASEVVPVVYITNETFKKTRAESIDYLAKRVIGKLGWLCGRNGIRKQDVKEIQFDCDWSGTSQSRYFAFLESIKKQRSEVKGWDSLKVSATIRLHQVKYAKKTGVPPVDNGVLMFYNMGNLSDTATSNSILDLKTAQKYMVNFEQYPLKLDVALPLFCWGIQFRHGKVVQLMNNLSESQLKSNENMELLRPNYYRVKKSSYLNDQFVYKGDEIRLENISTDQLRAAKALIDDHIQNKQYDIIYYHLDEPVLKNYAVSNLKAL